MRRGLVALLGCLALGACETPYQEMGLLGGVQATRISTNTAQIVAQGNGYTDEATIQRYALRKAAEETLNDGFDLFQIGDTSDTTRVGAQTFGSAYGTRYGAFGSSFTMPIIKPGQTFLIRMTKGPAPSPLPPGVFDAHEIASFAAVSDHRDCTTGDNGKVTCK